MDQVVVVFYVADHAGVKIADQDRLNEVKKSLLDALRGLDIQPQESPQE
jgi:hypothetical protein